MSEERWHGTIGGYTNHACRCDGCRAAQTEYRRTAQSWRAWRARNRRAGLNARGKPYKIGPDDARRKVAS